MDWVEVASENREFRVGFAGFIAREIGGVNDDVGGSLVAPLGVFGFGS